MERREQVGCELIAALDVGRPRALHRTEHVIGEPHHVLHERDEQVAALLEVGDALHVGAELRPQVVDAGQPRADRAADRAGPLVHLIVA